jgi:hypothetical protein
MNIAECGHEVPLPCDVTTVVDYYWMGIGEHNIVVDNGESSDITIRLPECMAAAGGLYSVLVADANAFNIYVHTNELDPQLDMILDGATKTYVITLTAAEDYVLLFSTGRNWVVVNKKVT